MTIGIDISQLAYPNTGVANYLKNLIESLAIIDKKNKYILFYSSLRRGVPNLILNNDNFKIRSFKFPPTVLDLLWNRLHMLSIDSLLGELDVFLTSDWTEPPSKKTPKASILYDLIIYKYPKETALKVVKVQKRKLKWLKKESKAVICISEATKKDASDILNIEKNKLYTIYPGI